MKRKKTIKKIEVKKEPEINEEVEIKNEFYPDDILYITKKRIDENKKIVIFYLKDGRKIEKII